MGNGPVEPRAEAREFANACYQTFVALTLEGFTEQQALVIIGQMIAINGQQGGTQ